MRKNCSGAAVSWGSGSYRLPSGGFQRVTEDIQHAVCSLRGGGLKTLRDTAAPPGFQALVARKRGPSMHDDFVFGELSEGFRRKGPMLMTFGCV